MKQMFCKVWPIYELLKIILHFIKLAILNLRKKFSVVHTLKGLQYHIKIWHNNKYWKIIKVTETIKIVAKNKIDKRSIKKQENAKQTLTKFFFY